MSIASLPFPRCQKVLPAVYDDSLSYYEVLCHLRAKINEVIDVFNTYEDVINELAQKVIELDAMKAQISALESDVSIINNHLNTIDGNADRMQVDIEKLYTLVNGVITDYNNVISYIDAKYNELLQRINNQSFTIYKELYLLIGELQAQIDALSKTIEELDTKAYNPWARLIRKESLQQNLNYAYADLADEVPTATEYSELGLTANEYTAKNLSAYEYSVRGKHNLHLDFIFAPVYGVKQSVGNVLTSIINFICGTMSATEYSALDLTADEYSALDLTAGEYYYYNNNGQTLTANEYETINVLNSGLLRV